MRIKKILWAFCLLCLAGGAVACSEDKDEPIPVNPAKVLGTYTFNDTNYEVLLAKYAENEDSYTFIFSPLDGTTSVSTYVAIGVKKYFDGKEFNVVDVFHNDEYSFIYEDPIYFYSEYRKLQGGTMYVKRNGAGDNFTIKVDVVLADGKVFKIDFKGDLTPPASIGQ